MKTHYVGNAFLLGLFVTLFFLSSCSSLLSANFNTDTPGSAPDPSLPGEPSGDALIFTAPFGDHLEIVNLPAFPSKALKFKNLESGRETNRGGIIFQANSTNFKKPLTFTWAGAKFGTGSVLNITLGLSPSFVMANLQIDNSGDLSLLTLSGTTLLGRLRPEKKYSFVVSFSPSDRNFTITVVGRGEPTIRESGISFFTTSDFPSSIRPTFGMKFDNENVNPEHYYILDDLVIAIKDE